MTRTPLVELRCPTCHAPVASSSARAPIDCAYCGAQLHAAATRTVHALSIERVGPSNRARVAELLRASTHLAPTEIERLLAAAPCDLVELDEASHAEALRDALADAGVVARVETRQAVAPFTTRRSVLLERVGAGRLAVMKLVREHLDLGLDEAKRLVDAAPSVLADGLDPSHAEALASALIAAGASAHVR